MQKDFQLLILIYVTLSQPNRIFLCLLKTLNFILKIFALYVNSKIAFSDLKGFTPRGKIYKKRRNWIHFLRPLLFSALSW